MMKKKHWHDLTPPQKVGMVLMSILQITMLAAALWDLQQRSDKEVVGDKNLWRAIVFVNFIGPLAYFFFGRKPVE